MDKRDGKWTVRIDGTSLPSRDLIGGKAWSIAHMSAHALPVPPAFVLTTEACRAYRDLGELPGGLADEVAEGIAWLQAETGRLFGPQTAPKKGLFGRKKPESGPLLVSVRSGAPISMPGMMDTVLNLGMNTQTEDLLAAESGDAAFARDTHRRFYELYAGIVLKAIGLTLDPADTPDKWQAAIAAATGARVPDDPGDQLEAAIKAVFDSWNSRRAKRYRAHHHISDDLGTAVVIQAMVFGNLDAQSGTGVLFSRNPLTGAREPYGEYLPRAQGEDVVSGKFTPQPLDTLNQSLPAVYRALLDAATTLETENKDVQDIEFTVQKGTLYLLQSRAAKRAPEAAVEIAVDMVDEGMIDEATALQRVTSDQVRVLLRPRLKAGATEGAEVLAKGEGACQGIGVGTVVTDTDEAEARAERGEDVILARPTTSPEDVHGMIAAKAIVTEKGGSTSHAAVVSRALGLPCIVGCGEGRILALQGRDVTVDGGEGAVYAGALPVTVPRESDDPTLTKLIAWAQARSPIRIDRPGQSEPADIIDLDRTPGGEDPAQLPALLAGKTSAKGGALASDEGVRAAIGAGVKAIYIDPVLPALLAALHMDHPDPDKDTLATDAQG